MKVITLIFCSLLSFLAYSMDNHSKNNCCDSKKETVPAAAHNLKDPKALEKKAYAVHNNNDGCVYCCSPVQHY